MKRIQWLFFILILLCMVGCAKEEYNKDYARCSQTSALDMVEIENGFFFAYDYILYYADKSNMSLWVPVCNKPDCAHQQVNVDPTTGLSIRCNAYVDWGDIVEKDGKIYSIRDSADPNNGGIYVYEIAQDGSGAKDVYKIPLESDNISGGRLMVLHNCFLVYYVYLDEHGMYQYRLERLEEDGSIHTLYSAEKETQEGSSHYTVNGLGTIRGENVIVSAFLSKGFGLENFGDDSIFWRVDGDIPEQLIIPEGEKYFYSYVSGNTFIYYKREGERGFYKFNLETKEEELLQASHSDDGYGMVLNEQWFVETNLFTREDAVEPYLRYFDGEKWTSVEIPEELTQLNCNFTIKSLASDRIFMKAAEMNTDFPPTYLYYFMIDEESPKLLLAFQDGEIAMKDDSNQETEESTSEEEIVDVIIPISMGDVEETVIFDNDEVLLKITDIAFAKDSQGEYLRCNFYWENNTSEDFQISIPSYSINGLQFGKQVGFDMKAESTSLSEGITEMDKIVDFYDIDTILQYYDETEITDIQLQVVLDGGSMEQQEMVMVHIYPCGEENIVTFSREEQETDKVVLDNESVKITVVGYDTNKYYNGTNNVIYFFVENKTDKEFTMYVSECEANGFTIGQSMFDSTTIETYNKTIIHGNSGAFVSFLVTDARYGGDIDKIEDVIEELKIKLKFHRYYLDLGYLENNHLFEEEIILNP